MLKVLSLADQKPFFIRTFLLPVITIWGCFTASTFPAYGDGEPFSYPPIPYFLPSTTVQVGDEMWLSVGPQSNYYFGWEHSPDLQTHWSMADMAPGTGGATFHFLPDPLIERDFFRVRAINVWSPGDADEDGIDDLWELSNGLDPVSAADAAQLHAGQPSGGLSNPINRTTCHPF